ncbi:hypothetical protein LXL04_031976 [Taraxacum kok-saghyz]
MALLKQFEYLQIQLQDILSATNSFDEDYSIGEGGFGKIYKAELLLSKEHTTTAIKRLDRKRGQGDSEFWKEVMMLSVYKHENIVSLLGFCDEKDEKILVYKYEPNRSLESHLCNNSLTWARRLNICIGAARGLAYLHDPGETQQRILHRDIKSANILLDENWNARITDFGLSKYGPANQKYTFIVSNNIAGTMGYCDPVYFQTGILTKESDIYSFGVVLFEILCGRLCLGVKDKTQSFVQSVRTHYKQNKLDEIVWVNMKDEIHPSSLKVFSTIACQCLKSDIKKRPLMAQIVTELETALTYQGNSGSPSFGLSDVGSTSSPKQIYSKIQHTVDLLSLEDSSTRLDSITEFGDQKSVMTMDIERVGLELIRRATNNFGHENFIGEGSSGRVYRGEFFHSEDRTMGAVKCFNVECGSSDAQFWREIMLLSEYRHENLTSFIGFCDENGEKIIVYQYASNKSLDFHIGDPKLTWIQRLKICLGAACGLQYLHDPRGAQQRVIHRDFKSANILLDENWNAKISDFGLSNFAYADQQHTFVFTTLVGTNSYCDPMYVETGLLTKESDVYSFGVVLFEVLCSRLCVDFSHDDQRQSLPLLVKKCYKDKKLDTIINVDLRQQIEQNCFDTFVQLAYQCLHKDRTQRPSMELVVSKLATALQYQEGKLTKKVDFIVDLDKKLQLEPAKASDNDSESVDSDNAIVTTTSRARDRARAKARGKARARAKAKAKAKATELNRNL